jgi:hypothetical protein
VEANGINLVCFNDDALIIDDNDYKGKGKAIPVTCREGPERQLG